MSPDANTKKARNTNRTPPDRPKSVVPMASSFPLAHGNNHSPAFPPLHYCGLSQGLPWTRRSCQRSELSAGLRFSTEKTGLPAYFLKKDMVISADAY